MGTGADARIERYVFTPTAWKTSAAML